MSVPNFKILSQVVSVFLGGGGSGRGGGGRVGGGGGGVRVGVNREVNYLRNSKKKIFFFFRGGGGGGQVGEFGEGVLEGGVGGV